MKILLAINIAYENRPTEAVAMGQPLCGYAFDYHPGLHDMMVEKAICE